MLPKLTDEEAGELRDTASGKKPVDPAKLEALKLAGAERVLRKAAESTAPCDWGLMREDGPGMLMPHLSKLREMANIATAQAEALFAQGKTGEGLDWLLVTHRIARHSGTGETLISYLVQASIEDIALRAAARHCLGWDETTRHGYADRLKHSHRCSVSRENYRGEKDLRRFDRGPREIRMWPEREEEAEGVLRRRVRRQRRSRRGSRNNSRSSLRGIPSTRKSPPTAP